MSAQSSGMPARRRSVTIFWQTFATTAGIALGAVVLVGIAARVALSRAFDAYLAGLPNHMSGTMGPGRGMGRIMLGAAEQTFLASVDGAVLAAAFVAVALALAIAYVVASRLSAPVRRLEQAALALADGDLAARTDPAGPEEIVALGEAFNLMAGRLEEAEMLRRRLVADVAHELRNPIAALRAQAEGMAEGVLAVDARHLESLVEETVHLTRLVDDLQELSLAEAGQLRYAVERVDLADMALHEVARARTLAHENVDVEVEVRPALDGTTAGACVEADPRRISQVLRNLLSNATRHTKSGSVTVRISAEGDDVVVRVVDTGEGIPASDLPHIFERFYRADAARAADTGGVGLGLAIVARLVSDHGGEVFAEPTTGGGATVGFRLPAADSRI